MSDNILHFTKHVIEALPTPPEGRAIYYDDRAAGLGLLKRSSGHTSFFWKRRVNGIVVWITLGDHALPLNTAREKADENNVKAAKWKASGYTGPNPFTSGPDLTFSELLEDYLAQHLKKHSTNPVKALKTRRWQFDKYLTHWKDRKIATVSREDVRRLHTKLAEEHPVTANRTITFLRTLYFHAIEDMGWRGENPAARPGKHKIVTAEKPRTRFIDESEMPRFIEQLWKEVNLDLRDFVALGLLTGARKSDILGAKWSQISGNVWAIPNTKEPSQPYIARLKPELVALLAERKKRTGSSPWLFPGDSASGHVGDLPKSFNSFLKRAGISGVTKHDLRRTFGSWLAKQNASPIVIGRALGHAPGSTATAIYSRLQDADGNVYAEKATTAMLSARAPEAKEGQSDESTSTTG